MNLMQTPLGKYSPQIYALLRIVAGLMFAMHGSQKLLGFPGGGPSPPTAPLMWVAGIIELVGGLMIAFGWFTSYAAFIASGQMAAAYFMAHASQGYYPILNRGELAVVYCFLFLYIAAQGSGIWSIDSSTRRR
jgi:putative oxidoreductase